MSAHGDIKLGPISDTGYIIKPRSPYNSTDSSNKSDENGKKADSNSSSSTHHNNAVGDALGGNSSTDERIGRGRQQRPVIEPLFSSSRPRPNGHPARPSYRSVSRKRARSDARNGPRRRLLPVNNNRDFLAGQDVDEFDDDDGSDHEDAAATRNAQARYLPPSHQASFNQCGDGTLPRRLHALNGRTSLSRSNTIGLGGDQMAASPFNRRMAGGFQPTCIPPPPSEPPPATPMSGSIMSGLCHQAPYVDPSPYAMRHQQQPPVHGWNPSMIHSGQLAPNMMSSSVYHAPPAPVNNNPLAYHPTAFSPVTANHQMTNPQMLQAAMLLQQQQQVQQQQLLAASMMSNPHQMMAAAAAASGTLGTTSRSLNQPQYAPFYPTMGSSQGNPVAASNNAGDYDVRSQQLIGNQQQPNSPNSGTDDGSVIYAANNNGALLLGQQRMQANSLPASLSQSDALLLASRHGVGLDPSSANTIDNTSPPPPMGLPPANQSNTFPTDEASETQRLLMMSAAASSQPMFMDPVNNASQQLYATTQQLLLQQQAQHQQQLIDSAGGGKPLDVKQRRSPSGDGPPTLAGWLSNQCKCPWYYWLVGLLILAFLMALVLAVSFSVEKRRLDQRLNQRFPQDPEVIGLFDPTRPPVLLKASQPLTINLEPMGLWTGRWRVGEAGWFAYNVTLSSLFSRVGLLWRLNTTPTVIEHDMLDRLHSTVVSSNGGNSVVDQGRRRSKRSADSIDQRRKTKSAGNSLHTGRVHYLEPGTWFLSIINDQPREVSLEFVIAPVAMQLGCPNDCSKRGICSLGKCDCINGFKGADCSTVDQVDVCNGNGNYVNGQCQCFAEWKGLECETLWSECIDPNCNGNGQCLTGQCKCFDGYAGELCQQRLCPNNCTGNGLCQPDGHCRCFHGWVGDDCGEEAASLTVNPVSSTGSRQLMSSRQRQVQRDSPDSAHLLDSITPVCDLDCGPHGHCVDDGQSHKTSNQRCQCDHGWSGHQCNDRLCDPRCHIHGHCLNGTCLCQPGWNGRHCTFDGCPNACNEHLGRGYCVKQPSPSLLFDSAVQYACNCSSGQWKGASCELEAELECNDGLDNDGDNLIDCLDPDCCSSDHCESFLNVVDIGGDPAVKRQVTDARESCAFSHPVDYQLLITPIPPPGASFYARVEFLVRRDKLILDSVDPRRISIIRGRVLQPGGSAFRGCRVSDARNAHLGFTLTDKSGRFDLPVEGGSFVLLEFLRYPTKQFTAFAPVYASVNQLVNIGDFYLDSRSSLSLLDNINLANQQCSSIIGQHHSLTLGRSGGQEYPRVEADSLLSSSASPSHYCTDADKVVCVRDGGILNINIGLDENSPTRLVYTSNRQSLSSSQASDSSDPASVIGSSIIRLLLLPPNQSPPSSLLRVDLLINLAGRRYERRLAPDVGLEWRLDWWNRTDAYNQPLYGLVHAKVSVGYIYRGCGNGNEDSSGSPSEFPLWEHRTLLVEANQPNGPQVANWDLNLVHYYAPNLNIVYRGDGSRQFLAQTELYSTPILGRSVDDSSKRAWNDCSECDTNSQQPSPTRRLISGQAMVADAVGNLLVGDGGYLRLITSPEQPIASSDSFDTRARLAVSSNNRSRWLATSSLKLDFLQLGDTFDEDQIGAYCLTTRPNFLAQSGDGSLDPTGLFLSHPKSRTVWWWRLPHRHRSAAGNQPTLLLADASASSQEEGVQPLVKGHTLVDPGGVVVTLTDLYFADAKAIWRLSLSSLDPDPIHRTMIAESRQAPSNTPVCLVGECRKGSPPITVLCDGFAAGHQVKLNSTPIHLVYSPVEEVLYFADDFSLYRLHLATNLVSVVDNVGRPSLECPSTGHNVDPSSSYPIITSLAIGPDGDLFIGQSDGRVWRRPLASYTTDQSTLLPVVDGGRDDQLMARKHLIGSSTTHQLTRDLGIDEVGGLAVNLYSELFIADSGRGLVYRSAFQGPTRIPPTTSGVTSSPDTASPFHRLVSTSTDVSLTFNSQGQLVESAGNNQLLTYSVLYRGNGGGGGGHSTAQLPSQLVGSGGDDQLDLSIDRDSRGNPLTLTTSSGHRYLLDLDHSSSADGRLSPPLLLTIHDPARGGQWRFSYSPSNLLIRLQSPLSGGAYHFLYSRAGRLETVITPDGGRLTGWQSVKLDSTRLVGRSDRHLYRIAAGPSPDALMSTTSVDARLTMSGEWSGQLIQIDSSTTPVILGRWFELPRLGLANNVEWRFKSDNSVSSPVTSNSGDSWSSRRRQSTQSLVTLPAATSRKTLLVNDSPLLRVEFDSARLLETYTSPATNSILLQIAYNAQLRPMIYNATSPSSSSDYRQAIDLEPLTLSYSSNGKISQLSWGSLIYRFTSDINNRDHLLSVDLGSSLDSIAYRYGNPELSNHPTSLIASGSGQFNLLYSTPQSSSSYSTAPALTGLITPSGLRRQWRRVVGINYQRFLFNPWPASDSQSTTPWITLDFDIENDQLIDLTWPSRTRSVTIARSANQSLTISSFDETIVSSSSNLGSDRIEDHLSGFTFEQITKRQGHLTTSLDVEASLPGVYLATQSSKSWRQLENLFSARFTFEYNNQLQLVSSQAQFSAPINDRITKTTRSVPISQLIVTNLTFDLSTHHLASYGPFDLVQKSSQLSVITYAPANLELSRRLDSQGRLINLLLYSVTSRHLPYYNLTLSYEAGLLQPTGQHIVSTPPNLHRNRFRLTSSVGSSTSLVFKYGPDGRIESLDRRRSHGVTKPGRVEELVYNAEGRLARLRLIQRHSHQYSTSLSHSEELQLIYDSRGLLLRRGNWHYQFDEDGFLVKRSSSKSTNDIVDRFAHNAKGQLTWAEREIVSGRSSIDDDSNDDFPGSSKPFRVEYLYDSQGRLTLIRNTLEVDALQHYFYADPSKPHRLTHMVDYRDGSSSPRLYQFFYHNENLFALQQIPLISPPSSSSAYSQSGDKQSDNRRVFFILANHDASPMTLIDQSGQIVWTADYSPTGGRTISTTSTKQSSNQQQSSSLLLPIGYRGCLQDTFTDFVLCPSTSYRAFDPLGASFTAPDPFSLLSSRLPSLMLQPTLLDTHKWSMESSSSHPHLHPLSLFNQLQETVLMPRWWINQSNRLAINSLLPSIDISTAKGGCNTDCLAVNRRVEKLSITDRLQLKVNTPPSISLDSFPIESVFTDPGIAFNVNSDGHVESVVVEQSSLDSPTTHHPLDNSRSIQLTLARLFTKSRLLDSWTTTTTNNGRLAQLFSLDHANLTTTANHVLDQLFGSSRSSVLQLATDFNCSLAAIDDGDKGSSNREVRLTRTFIEYRLLIGTSSSASRTIRRQAIIERGRRNAWSRESSRARLALTDSSLASSTRQRRLYGLGRVWSWSELKQLASFGQGHRGDLEWQQMTLDLDSSTSINRLLGRATFYRLRRQRRWLSPASAG